MKDYWIQVLKRAAWIFFWMNLTIIIVFWKTVSFQAEGLPRSIGFCMIISAIVQAFKKPDQQGQVSQGRNAYQEKYSKLLNMVGGDRATADRLISAYGIDRAISDLERDRRIN